MWIFRQILLRIILLARFGLHRLNLQKEIKTIQYSEMLKFKPETAKKMAKQNMIQEMLFDVN
jgi:hypothetical protein